MNTASVRRRRLVAAITLAVLISSAAANTEVVIGVLAVHGSQRTLARWQPTADYLAQKISGYRFVVRALSADGLQQAVNAGKLDFVLTDPSNYIVLRRRYGISRIVTLRNRAGGQIYAKCGAVIFVRADRRDIQHLRDLKGKSLMAVSGESFGGFQLAWLTLLRHGVDPFRNLSRLMFNGYPEDDIVYAVGNGEIDAGTVPSGVLESMAAQAKIDITRFRVLNPRTTPGYPIRHSTPLYPDWPLSKTGNTSDELTRKIAVALLTMAQNDPAAQRGNYAGWAIPLDYGSVQRLVRELRIDPTAQTPTLDQLVRANWQWAAMALVIVLFLLAITVYVARLNRRLKASSASLQRALDERRRASAEMQKLSSALEQTADLVMITSPNGVIEYVNPAFERVTGYERQLVVGATPNLLKSGVHDSEFYARLWHTLVRGEVFSAVFINRRQDGALYYEEKTITPVLDSRGEVRYFVSTGKDITDRTLAEQRARQHEAEFAHVARVSTMGEMASALAHELNQPLAAIVNYARGCTRRLRSGNVTPEDLMVLLTRIAEQGERSGEIIRRLRNFMSKNESNRTLADLNEIVREAASLANLEARHRRVKLHLELQPRALMVLADHIQIEQVVLNLVRNAIEAIHNADSARRQVTIRTARTSSGAASVCVHDTGPGLDIQDEEALFGTFFSTKKDGMGMGLSISRSIIEAHGGQLSVSETSDAGTAFIFTLPRTSDDKSNDNG